MKITHAGLVKTLSSLRNGTMVQLLSVLQQEGDSHALNNAITLKQKHNARSLEIRAYDSFDVKDQLKSNGFQFGDDFNGCYWNAFSHWNFDEAELPEGPNYTIF